MNKLLDAAVTGLLQKLELVACERIKCSECGAVIDGCGAKAATAQDYSNVLKFLKDNGFEIKPEKATSELGKILEHMDKHGKYPDSTIPS